MRIGMGNWSTWRKPAPVPHCPPQTPHDLTGARTWAAAVGSWQLTTSTMAWPLTHMHVHTCMSVCLSGLSVHPFIYLFTWHLKNGIWTNCSKIILNYQKKLHTHIYNHKKESPFQNQPCSSYSGWGAGRNYWIGINLSYDEEQQFGITNNWKYCIVSSEVWWCVVSQSNLKMETAGSSDTFYQSTKLHCVMKQMVIILILIAVRT
jgi:hypothetical protein